MTQTKVFGCSLVLSCVLGCSDSSSPKKPVTGTDAGNPSTLTAGCGGSAASSTDATMSSSSVDASAATDSGGSAAQATAATGGGTGGEATTTSAAESSTGAGGGGNGGAGASSTCKRGIAANVAPGSAFFPAVHWWYNWAIGHDGPDTGIEFVPMIWGASSAGDAIADGSSFLLGFNEPNFFAQANLSAEQAADSWPGVETSAAGVAIVSPAMNYCGPADQCHDTDPYQYLRDFFAQCDGCRVDYVAVHWYNCDLPSLRDYLEPGGNLEGFEQFGVPIWLTEFSCDPSASVEEQEAYMREAIPYLESHPQVFRYSWFSAGPIPNAILIEDDGTPTALGQVYIDLEHEPCD